nr:hypothetical protein HUO10_003264 [Paraburkholderia busanensis]
MKERPILFSGPMVRALLDGSKTQTRRIVKDQAVLDIAYSPIVSRGSVYNYSGDELLMRCPYGEPGDRLYVRETWSTDFAAHYPYDRVWYAADDDRKNDIQIRDGVRGIYSPESDEHVPFRWRPSIHMPRSASRITLEVTGVRVERLQEISEEDAKAEGVAPAWLDVDGQTVNAYAKPTYRQGFARLWRDINGDDSWDANPWVWCVSFKRVDA